MGAISGASGEKWYQELDLEPLKLRCWFGTENFAVFMKFLKTSVLKYIVMILNLQLIFFSTAPDLLMKEALSSAL